jgi:hypothetical protein
MSHARCSIRSVRVLSLAELLHVIIVPAGLHNYFHALCTDQCSCAGVAFAVREGESCSEALSLDSCSFVGRRYASDYSAS